jgi:drug/metabolite transporter (DMT)-like permease
MQNSNPALPATRLFPHQHLLPYLALGTGILALSSSAILTRWANAPGPVTASYRMLLAALILSPLFVRNTRKVNLKLTGAILVFPLLGGLFTALDHAVWNTSVNLTSAANATLLGNTAPLYVALFAWLVFHEQLKGKFWLGLAFALLGAGLVLGYDFLTHPTFGIGDLLALLAGVFYAGYFLVTQRGRQRLDTLSYVWMATLTAGLLNLGASLALGLPVIGYPAQTYLALLGLALICQVTGYLTVGYALGHLPASVVSPTMILQPVLTALLAIPLLGETLHPAQWTGGLVVLTGIFLVHRSREAG